MAEADWINLSGAETSPNIAEIYVLDDRVNVVLEVYIGDLEIFAELIPDDWLQETDEQRPTLEQRMQQFAESRLRIVTDSGQTLPAELVRVEACQRVDRRSPFAGMVNPYTRRMVPDAPAYKRVLYAEISYPLPERPSRL